VLTVMMVLLALRVQQDQLALKVILSQVRLDQQGQQGHKVTLLLDQRGQRGQQGRREIQEAQAQQDRRGQLALLDQLDRLERLADQVHMQLVLGSILKAQVQFLFVMMEMSHQLRIEILENMG
jgi:hypothetical protein